jgi:hypothetical protein
MSKKLAKNVMELMALQLMVLAMRHAKLFATPASKGRATNVLFL